MYEVLFWLLASVAVGFVVANTWELLLGALLLGVSCVMASDPLSGLGASPGSPSGGSDSSDDVSGTQLLRWFIRTCLVILAALLTWMTIPFREHYEQLIQHPDHVAIFAACGVTGLLTLVLTLWIDPINRFLRLLIKGPEKMKNGLPAR